MHNVSNYDFYEVFSLSEPPDINVTPDDTVVFCRCYNESRKIADFLAHHRAIGVTKFFIVDNDSTDGTGEFLRSQDDVIYLPSGKSYREFSPVWYRLICDTYCVDRWVLFLDVDELFIYPGWPKLKIDILKRYLDENHYDLFFAPMVDMYSSEPMDNLTYSSGDSLIESFPFFDSDGYRLIPRNRKHRGQSLPLRVLFGGPRDRIFGGKKILTTIDRYLIKKFFSINRSSLDKLSTFESLATRYIYRYYSKYVFSDNAAQLNKIPFIKWQKKYSLHKNAGAYNVHNIEAIDARLCPSWGALLHFKFLNDFLDRVDMAIERGEHWNKASAYKYYKQNSDKIEAKSFLYDGSCRFEGVESLVAHGLMRISPDMAAALERAYSNDEC